MKSKFYIWKLTSLLLLLISFPAFGQKRTGNIVEYFGKEKINEINEGTLLHVFSKGLVLGTQRAWLNSSTFPKDPVFQRFLYNDRYSPRVNDVFDVDNEGNEMTWQQVNVDATNSFSGNDLRSAYVYLTYRSNSEKTVLFEASGHSLALINGMPHEGDHYDFGWNLIPIKLKKGQNAFLLKVGRFPRIRARLIAPSTAVQFTPRDMTLPDILKEERQDYLGAIRIINATENWVKGYEIVCESLEAKKTTQAPIIPPLSVRKVPFTIPFQQFENNAKEKKVGLKLKNSQGKTVHDQEFDLHLKSNAEHHKRTFLSSIDGSVQYYSVAPSTRTDSLSQALFLSVHGASVEAVNQANAYKKKDWGNLIAPTNRRPFGFAWEDWGRLDALEVLKDAKSIFKPDPNRIYLTGHSMGGHGTWYLGATYPDQFAAIAPCAGYPDLLGYRDSFKKRLVQLTSEEQANYGITPKMLQRMMMEPVLTPVEKIIERAGTPSRTLKLKRNYLQHGVYILHGEKDNVVPTFIARDMRETLGAYHPDFVYYEYPDGTHWYGDHSVDWPPIFDFFKRRTIPKVSEIDKLEFYTGSPGISARSHFLTIHQQSIPFEVSSLVFKKENDRPYLTSGNVAKVEIDFSHFEDVPDTLYVDNMPLAVNSANTLFLEKEGSEWRKSDRPKLAEKGPHRNGGFKDAFTNNVVLVYATKGSKNENDWYLNKARFDAETFWYRANGNVEVIRDVDFNSKKYKDRNIVLYGNGDNNSAWSKLLYKSPVQVTNGEVNIEGKRLFGDQWGMYFIVPRTASDKASIGVVTATGPKGMKAAYANHYLINGTTFPDFLLFDDSALKEGNLAVKCAGFFGNDWSVKKGDFEWK